ncbi:MAG: T9SS type A sorting domain-containing protein [Flavobacteriales bacterium]|nr:T9SS type A sorting domain-containing protein [Flavobacteriales bacterium]
MSLLINTIFRRLGTLSLLLMGLGHVAFGTNFYTTQNGNFGTGSTWVGGTSPTHTISGADSVFVLHDVTITVDLSISGVLVIQSGAELNGNFEIKDVEVGGVLINYGTIDLGQKIDVDGSLYNYGTMLIDGDIHIDGYVCNAGTMTVTDNTNKVDLHGGTLECGGIVYACEFKFHEKNGNNYVLQDQNIDTCALGCSNGTVWDDNGNGTIDSNTVSVCGDTFNGGVLPIELIRFQAQRVSESIELQWATASETDNDLFVIERSTDLKQWKSIAQLPGAGSSSERLDYKVTDYNPPTALIYYRLVQIDYDGATTYSEVRSVLNVDQLPAKFSLFPNPSSGVITVRSEVDLKEATIALYDLSGRRLNSFISTSTEHQVVLDLNACKDGIYLLKIEGPGVAELARIVLQR